MKISQNLNLVMLVLQHKREFWTNISQGYCFDVIVSFTHLYEGGSQRLCCRQIYSLQL